MVGCFFQRLANTRNSFHEVETSEIKRETTQYFLRYVYVLRYVQTFWWGESKNNHEWSQKSMHFMLLQGICLQVDKNEFKMHAIC